MKPQKDLQEVNLKRYHFINKFIPFSYTKHKIFTIALVVTQIPLFCIIGFLLFNDENVNKNLIVVIALVITLFGTTLFLWSLHYLLLPIQVCSKALNMFLKKRQINTLPLHSNDEMGLLFKNLSKTLNELNKKEKALKITSSKDFLTGLSNRMATTKELEKLTALKIPFCLAMIDIDNFKEINDIHGHSAGDTTLKQFGFFLGTFLKNNNKNAWAARWGGEEFLLVIPGDMEVNEPLLNLLRVQTDENTTNYENSKIKFTISIGLTEYDFTDSQTNNINSADEALLAAKRSGKNQVTVQPK